MKNKISVLVLGIFLIGTISAMTINFYYSDSCPYCSQIKPLVDNIENVYPYEVIYYDTQTQEGNLEMIEEGFNAVPSFKIITDDCREIKFTGADRAKLICELQQMSTKECITISADSSVGGSWFID